MTAFSKFAALIRAGCVLASLALTTGCTQSLFYFPDHIVHDASAQLGVHVEKLSFTSKDGTRLNGWFIPAAGYQSPRDAKATVIHFHGNSQNISAHWRFASWLPQRGYNLFMFDYRGYGESDGTPTHRGVYEDSSSALEYVRSRRDIDPNKLVLFGQSLGGANAIAVAGSSKHDGIKAVVIEAAFASPSAIASDRVSWFGSLMDDTYSAERYVAQIAPIPLLLLHGTADTIIPFHHATRLYEAAREPKRLIVIEGGRHIQAFTPVFGHVYMDAVSGFLDEALSQKQDAPSREANLGEHRP